MFTAFIREWTYPFPWLIFEISGNLFFFTIFTFQRDMTPEKHIMDLVTLIIYAVSLLKYFEFLSIQLFFILNFECSQWDNSV